MSSDRYAPPEPDLDAYEDAWYRALKAKAARPFRDPQEEKVERSLPEPPSTTDEQEPEQASS